MIIGLISFPPFTNAEYAEVSFSNVVSSDPNDIDKSSFGLS